MAMRFKKVDGTPYSVSAYYGLNTGADGRVYLADNDFLRTIAGASELTPVAAERLARALLTAARRARGIKASR